MGVPFFKDIAKCPVQQKKNDFYLKLLLASPTAHLLKNPPANAGDMRDAGLIPGLGRSTGEGKGYPLQYSGLKNSMDCIVHGVAKSHTRANFTVIINISFKN